MAQSGMVKILRGKISQQIRHHNYKSRAKAAAASNKSSRLRRMDSSVLIPGC
jgi:hypothetical protein